MTSAVLVSRPAADPEGDTLTIATRQLRVTVHQPLWLEWSYRDEAGEWQPLANDRPTSAYRRMPTATASPII